MSNIQVDEDVREQIVLHNKGQKIFGVLHLPDKKTTKLPAVLICHGLAGHKTGKYRAYVALAKYLALQDIISLRIDFRGAGDSEGEFEETTVKGILSDAMTGIEFLQHHHRVDPSRIGLFGKSFGGMVALLAAQQWRQVKSLALWAPIFNGDYWREKWKLVQTNAIPQSHQEELMRINGQRASYAFFEEFFNTHMDTVLPSLESVPLLHVHGEKDAVVTISHADHYRQSRKNALDRTKFLRLPNADHDFSNPHDRQEAIEATTNWFQKTL
jgi:dipeptidyl aminopeptidase/acylaminoacyl peptidase